MRLENEDSYEILDNSKMEGACEGLCFRSILWAPKVGFFSTANLGLLIGEFVH